MTNVRITTLAAAAAILASATVAFAYPGQQYANRAHVSIAQARTIAMKAANGTIVAEELETEKGGSGLREVGVDARSGAVLENSADKGEASAAEPSEAGGESSEAPGAEKGEGAGN